MSFFGPQELHQLFFQAGGEAISLYGFWCNFKLCSVSCLEHDLRSYKGKIVFCCDSLSTAGIRRDNGY